MVIEIKVPALGESITEVTLASWMVAEGDYVEMDQSICELESDKATMEMPAEKAGTITFKAEEGSDLEIGDLLCTIDTSAAAPAGGASEEKAAAPKEEAKEQPAAVQAPAKAPASEKKVEHASPAAAKILRENDLTNKDANGTGKDGRITKEDAVKAVSNKGAASNGTATPATPAGDRTKTTQKMSRLRRTIASHLVNAKNNTAMLTTFNEVDLTEVKATRAKYKESFKEKYGVSLGFMSFFMKSCALGLMEMPQVNGQIDGDNMILHNYVDMSVAVSTPRGLVTPVLRNVEKLSLHEIEKGVKALALKGRDGKLKLEDMEGGTFTVSNGGVFGSLQSTPIINAPQSAILGMHKIQDRAMVVNGEVVVRPMMYLALSYDHRIIDGKEAVTFLVKVKEYLEDPIRLMLNI